MLIKTHSLANTKQLSSVLPWGFSERFSEWCPCLLTHLCTVPLGRQQAAIQAQGGERVPPGEAGAPVSGPLLSFLILAPLLHPSKFPVLAPRAEESIPRQQRLPLRRRWSQVRSSLAECLPFPWEPSDEGPGPEHPRPHPSGPPRLQVSVMTAGERAEGRSPAGCSELFAQLAAGLLQSVPASPPAVPSPPRTSNGVTSRLAEG